MGENSSSGGLDSAIESMKAKMKEAPPKPAAGKVVEGPADAPANSAAAAAPMSGSQLRSPAESLRMLADGAQAVRPATEAEEEIKKKQNLVREKIAAQAGRLAAEQRKLEEVQRELAKMSEPMRRDVELIRERLEVVDRDLAFADKDYAAKKKALEAATAVLEKKRKEKSDLADHLRLIIHESEVRKTQKLEEIMAKLGVGESSEVFQGF